MPLSLLVEPWAQALLLAADESNPWRRVGVDDTELTRIAHGVYLPSELWRAADDDERFLWRLRAIAVAHPRHVVFSHLSAARIWGLSTVGAWPLKPHITLSGHAHSGSTTAVTRTLVRDPFAHQTRDGLRVTSLARTVVDIARTQALPVALAIADQALRPAFHRPAATREELDEEISSSSSRGRAMARTVLELADSAAESVGESVSRASIHLAGFPAPQLQARFVDAEGRMFADFYWPEFELIGEFDGKGKYLKPEYLGNFSPGEAVYREKRREDRLRALGPCVTRWDWATALSPRLLRAHLLRAGLPLARGHTRTTRPSSREE
ncbi:type IV toxin-antitoxin system AbiEi family antitoxin domain-containing protein [Herbiconiux sp. SYSU D00978]|uniref:type IV toxin-antitoxin system AbiEi family antitoxin domain-containing protein n=1 Tax=Herbiconiux sp. SYSU D00978 TaxID=2812562 RepID=UPI001A958952|nr:hypothetical protein [Herbiconiux sp. SYSU D00978]